MKYLQKYSTAKNKKLTGAQCITICFILCVLFCVLSICIGSVKINPIEIWNTILGDRTSVAARIILHVRLPRTIACLCAGAGLAGAGVIIQSVLNNPLAGPNIIGVNAGAGFFAILFCAFFPQYPQLLPIGAFFGALLSVLLVYNIARKTGASKITIVLAGVAVNSVLNAGTDTIHTFIPSALVGGNGFRIGGMSSLQPKVLYPACVLIIIAVVVTYILRNELDVLSLGEDIAASLGMNIKKYRFLLLMCAALLAGASVSFAGLIGFVGLIVPHTARFFVGSEARYLFPLAALMGAVFLIACDILARTLFAPFEIPVGIILSFLGGPFFIWLLLKKKGGYIND